MNLFRFFLLLSASLLARNLSSPLNCWSTINTTVEANHTGFVGFQSLDNHIFAVYSSGFIKKWHSQNGSYLSEDSIAANLSIKATVEIPLSGKVLLNYSDGSIDLRNFEENYRLEASFKTFYHYLGLQPIPNTKFLYMLREKHIEKWTIAGEKISDIEQPMKNQRILLNFLYIPNTELLISYSLDSSLQFWNIKYDQFMKDVRVSLSQGEEISSLGYYAAMDVLLIGTTEGNLRFYNYNAGSVQLVIVREVFSRRSIVKIIVLEDFITVIGWENRVVIYKGKKKIREIDAILPRITDLKLLQDSKGLLMGYVAEARTVKTWRLSYHYNNKCWDVCPRGSFPRELDCESCRSNCDECQNSNVCQKCSKDYYLDEGSCVKGCGFFKSEEDDGTCKQRMISFSNVFFASLLFIGMELVRKFWKQIRSYIQRIVKNFFRKRCKDGTDSERELVKKIQELESKLKSSDSYNQELSNMLRSHRSSEPIENTQNVLKLVESSDLSFRDYAVLLPYEEITYEKTKDTRLGKGGFSTVYRAELFGSTWAVKKFSWVFSGESALDFKDIQNVVNEILIMNSLHHEKILRLRAFAFRIKPKKFSVKMVTELMNCDLRHLIYGEVPLSDGEKLSIALQILHGVNYLHSRRIQHLDLKPHNILVSGDHSEAKIADFGISKSNLMETKKTNVIGTTLLYASREYAIEGKVSPQKSDMWSYGAILFELFAGKRPWGEWDHEHVREFLEKKEDFLEKSKGALPGEIQRVVEMCMRYDTEQRVSSQELLKAFPHEIEGNYLKTIKSRS